MPPLSWHSIPFAECGSEQRLVKLNRGAESSHTPRPLIIMTQPLVIKLGSGVSRNGPVNRKRRHETADPLLLRRVDSPQCFIDSFPECAILPHLEFRHPLIAKYSDANSW